MAFGRGNPGGPQICEEIFQMQFLSRRKSFIRAFTEDLKLLVEKCDPRDEPLCLYGYAKGTWEVTREEEIPCEVPEPCCGINWQMLSMNIEEWINSVAMRSDAWLLRIISVISGLYGLDREQRGILYDKISDLDTILEEVTRYYSRNNVPDIVKSIYYGKRLISVPGNNGVNNVDQRNNGEQQQIMIDLTRISGNNGVSGTNGDQRNNGQQQHRTIDLISILGKTEDQINNGEQQHKRIDMISVSQNTRDQRNNGEQPHESSNLTRLSENIGDQRNNGEQPHKRSNPISISENTGDQRNNGDQPHKRSNMINVSKSNGDQKNNGGRPHKRERRSNKFNTKKQHGKKRSGKQKEEKQFVEDKTSEQFVEDQTSDDHCGMCGKLASMCGKLAKEYEFWILCDVCERWFHGYCVGVDEEDAKSIGKFECPLCKQRQRKRHRTQ